MSAAAPAEPLLRLRPLGLGELLDDVFRVYRRHFWLLFGVSLLLSLPTLAFELASGTASALGFFLAAIPDLANPSALAARQPPAPPNLVLSLLGDLVQIAMVPFTVGAITRAAIDAAQGSPVTIRSALGGVVRRYWALMGLTLLFVALSPLVLCLPVLVWLAVRWVVAIPAMLAEGVGPIRGLDRSWTLTRGHWWRLAGTLLVMYLLQYGLSAALGVLGVPVAIVVPFVPDAVRGGIVLTVEVAAVSAVLPVVYLTVVLLYFDLRIRREDFDLDHLARQAVGLRA